MKFGTRFLAVLIGFGLLTGCALFKRPGSIVTPQGTVVGVKDAGKPATINSEGSTATITLPAGTNVTTVKETALASIPATSSNPYVPPRPERETTTFVLPSEAKWQKVETKLSANTGTVDTSIAKAKIDAEESRILLYASIVSAIAAGFFVYRAYPTPAIACGAGSVVFFLAWKMSGMPDWFWVLGVAGLVGAVFLYLGHNRGLSDSIQTTK